MIPDLETKFKRIDALEFCNTWNNKKKMPRAYLEEESGNFIAEYTIPTLGEVSPDYVKTSIIRLNVVSIKHFFETLCKYSETGVLEL